MKRTNKYLSLALAIIMALSLCVTSFAAEITIKPNVPADGTSAGEEFNAYKIFDATFTGETVAEGDAISYTIENTSDFYSVIDGYTWNGADVFDLEAVANSTTKFNVIVKVNNYEAADLATKLAAVIDAETPIAKTVDTRDSKGNYVLGDLAKGYYIITSTLGSKIIVQTLGEVEINTKNEYPSMTKKIVDGVERVDSITADYGNTITFEIAVTIPATVNGDIIVHDTMDANLINPVLTPCTGVSVLTDCDDEECEGNVHFTVDYDAVAKEGNVAKFQYTATLKANATTNTALPNTAWITYSGFTSVVDTVNVYTYEADVYKYTQNVTGVKSGLAGAGFVIKNEADLYYKNTDGIVTWVANIADATEYTTAENNNYTVKFAGIKNGTYTVIEKTVPAGYNPLATNPTFEIANTNAPLTEVLNQSGAVLPGTGGVGTTMFYVLGSVMMIGAAVLLVTKKKMANEQ